MSGMSRYACLSGLPSCSAACLSRSTCPGSAAGTTSTFGRRSVPSSSASPSRRHRFFSSAVNTSLRSGQPNWRPDSTAESNCFVAASRRCASRCLAIHSWSSLSRSWPCSVAPVGRSSLPRNNTTRSMAFVFGSLWCFSCPCANPLPWASRALIRQRTKPEIPKSPEDVKSSSV